MLGRKRTLKEHEHRTLGAACVMWWYLNHGHLTRYFPRMLLVLALAARRR